MIDCEQLLEVLRSRRSIRRFSDQPVSRDDIARLLEAAHWAPSNHNRQPWRFLVVEDRVRIRSVGRSVGQSLAVKLKSLPPLASAYAGDLAHYATLFVQAPVLIVALHKRPVSVSAALLEGVPNPALVSGEPLSVAMAVQNLLLAAHTLGLGACVMTATLLVQDAVAAALPLPAGFDLTCFVALGHPAESPEAPRRKKLEQCCVYIDDDERTDDDRNRNL
jgi:coenzyme F420-0:L-glutamate ligase/coenzyme F420-1:gamma-L-glutamate ligase